MQRKIKLPPVFWMKHYRIPEVLLIVRFFVTKKYCLKSSFIIISQPPLLHKKLDRYLFWSGYLLYPCWNYSIASCEKRNIPAVRFRRGYWLLLLVIQDFLGNVNGAVLSLLKSSAYIFSDNADAEQLHCAEEQEQNDNRCITWNINTPD